MATTANLRLNLPTVGGDSGGEDGTDATGWPTQINENFVAIDEAIATLRNTNIEIPANVCTVLERDMDPFLVAGMARTTLGTYTIPSDALNRSIRVEMLGIVPASSGSGRYIDVWITLGGQDILQARLPMDQDSSGILNLPFYLNVTIIPFNATTPYVLGIVGVGGAGVSPDGNTIGSCYGFVAPMTPVGSTNAVVDLSIDQDLTIDVQMNNVAMGFQKNMVKIIRE